MKTTDKLRDKNGYPIPTTGTKIMAFIMALVILCGVIMFIGGIYYILYLILKMI
jgi:hypothetical protein